MKEILYNMALIHVINKCKENNIDCSNTRLIKENRKFAYQLVNNDSNKCVLRITLHKNSVPSYGFN